MNLAYIAGLLGEVNAELKKGGCDGIDAIKINRRDIALIRKSIEAQKHLIMINDLERLRFELGGIRIEIS
jgi:hypothetical protein